MARFTVTAVWGEGNSGTGHCADCSSRKEMLKEAQALAESIAKEIKSAVYSAQCIGTDIIFVVKLKDVVIVRILSETDFDFNDL